MPDGFSLIIRLKSTFLGKAFKKAKMLFFDLEGKLVEFIFVSFFFLIFNWISLNIKHPKISI